MTQEPENLENTDNSQKPTSPKRKAQSTQSAASLPDTALQPDVAEKPKARRRKASPADSAETSPADSATAASSEAKKPQRRKKTDEAPSTSADAQPTAQVQPAAKAETSPRPRKSRKSNPIPLLSLFDSPAESPAETPAEPLPAKSTPAPRVNAAKASEKAPEKQAETNSEKALEKSPAPKRRRPTKAAAPATNTVPHDSVEIPLVKPAPVLQKAPVAASPKPALAAQQERIADKAEQAQKNISSPPVSETAETAEFTASENSQTLPAAREGAEEGLSRSQRRRSRRKRSKNAQAELLAEQAQGGKISLSTDLPDEDAAPVNVANADSEIANADIKDKPVSKLNPPAPRAPMLHHDDPYAPILPLIMKRNGGLQEENWDDWDEADDEPQTAFLPQIGEHPLLAGTRNPLLANEVQNTVEDDFDDPTDVNGNSWQAAARLEKIQQQNAANNQGKKGKNRFEKMRTNRYPGGLQSFKSDPTRSNVPSIAALAAKAAQSTAKAPRPNEKNGKTEGQNLRDTNRDVNRDVNRDTKRDPSRPDNRPNNREPNFKKPLALAAENAATTLPMLITEAVPALLPESALLPAAPSAPQSSPEAGTPTQKQAKPGKPASPVKKAAPKESPKAAKGGTPELDIEFKSNVPDEHLEMDEHIELADHLDFDDIDDSIDDSPGSSTKAKRTMYVSVHQDEQVEVVITENGQMIDYFVEMAHQAKIRGNIYKGVINNVDTNLQAAFVNFGGSKNGFLQIDEVHPEYWLSPHDSTKGRKYPLIQKVLKVGQEVLVQIVKEPAGTKGAFLTTWVSLAGRFLVLTPGQEQIGVSRKVEDPEERARLKELLAGIEPGEDMGVIIRTASEGASKTSIQKDLQYLKRLWKDLRKRATTDKTPALIYQEADLARRAVRDYLSEEVEEVWVDDESTVETIREMATLLYPRRNGMVKLHQDPRQTLWERFNLQRQLESVTSREVVLPSGGRLVFDQTEALMAIDINSGKTQSKSNFEGMVHKTNMEAAEAIARHLRLRDIGGQVVIDFIEMRDKAHCREVEKTLRNAMKGDRARHDIGHLSAFGLLELVRQRTGSSAISISSEPCPHCRGTGVRRNMEWQALQALREIENKARNANKNNVFTYETDMELALYLLNSKRERLVDMETKQGVKIEIKWR